MFFQSDGQNVNIAVKQTVPDWSKHLMPLINGVEKSSSKVSNAALFKKYPILIQQTKQTSDWMVDIQRIIRKSSKNGPFRKLRHQYSRSLRSSIVIEQRNNNDQETRSTETPIFKIFAPDNGNRFDAWGG